MNQSKRQLFKTIASAHFIICFAAGLASACSRPQDEELPLAFEETKGRTTAKVHSEEPSQEIGAGVSAAASAVAEQVPFPGSRLYRSSAGARGIILLHGSEGGNERYIDDYGKKLAAQGFFMRSSIVISLVRVPHRSSRTWSLIESSKLQSG